jgi:DnaK suppressor protein
MATTIQYDEIRRMLTARRRDLQNEIHNNLRDVRADALEPDRYGTESGDTSEVHPEGELAFALLEIKGQVLTRINDAVRRLDDGTYGLCAECGDPIARARLRALPFAVRCRECEEMHEQSAQRDGRQWREDSRHC